jgi:molybdate transport system regulatory protein
MKDKSINDSALPQVKVHVWFEKDEGVYFGHGRYELLLLIDELGSLKHAAEKMGISYRGAWGKIKKTEEVIGQPLIYKDNNKEGYKLTEFGKEFVDEFRSYYDDVTEFARKRGMELLTKIKIL